MRHCKTVARIFLILSAVNYTFASLARSWAMHEARADLVKVAEDTTEVSEKGRMPSEERSEMRSMAGNGHPRDELAEPEADAQTSKAYPEVDKFFSKEMNEKITEYYILATVLAFSTGISRGAQNQISAAMDSHRYVLFYFCYQRFIRPNYKIILICRSSTVGRDLNDCAFGVFQTLNDHPLAQSRYLPNFRDKDLRFLRTLSRRLLESLD
jgi:hypothetical protein